MDQMGQECQVGVASGSTGWMVLKAELKSTKRILAKVPEEFRCWRRRCSGQATAFLCPSRPCWSSSNEPSIHILCVALRFFANGSFLYNVGDAEHLSKATVCRAVRKVCLALKRLLPIFVVFPGHKPVRAIKEVLGGGLRG
ncbi:hypothetical protein N1851_018304 [Merluccius polli]|uniref:Nuclease HARBI1 n=1 Tax=Merluccius polli TaxID=89951 RepID=A0AA47MNI7_MERPO|nr:hypothetical protein N1851_018304 [Merluccius polli]